MKRARRDIDYPGGWTPPTDDEMPLFARGAASRKKDPSTSHEAARLVEAKGKAARDRKTLLAAVRKQPGLTGGELSRATGLDRYTVSRRLPELRDCEPPYVANGERRICTALDSRQITWWPAGGIDS